MQTSTIRHGDIVIDIRDDGAIQLVRQSNAQAIVLSITEFAYIVRVAELFHVPIAEPGDLAVRRP